MNIICDIDSVIVDLVPEWLRLYNQGWDDDLKLEDIYTYDLAKVAKAGKEIYEVLSFAGLYAGCDPVKGAIEGVGELRQMGHNILFVTSAISEEQFEWMVGRGLTNGLDYLRVPRQKKHLVRADAIIDDHAETVETYPGRGIVFDQPWNREWKELRRYGKYRAKDWEEVVAIVRSWHAER